VVIAPAVQPSSRPAVQPSYRPINFLSRGKEPINRLSDLLRRGEVRGDAIHASGAGAEPQQIEPDGLERRYRFAEPDPGQVPGGGEVADQGVPVGRRRTGRGTLPGLGQ
jgi:hypothetical protein